MVVFCFGFLCKFVYIFFSLPVPSEYKKEKKVSRRLTSVAREITPLSGHLSQRGVDPINYISQMADSN